MALCQAKFMAYIIWNGSWSIYCTNSKDTQCAHVSYSGLTISTLHTHMTCIDFKSNFNIRTGATLHMEKIRFFRQSCLILNMEGFWNMYFDCSLDKWRGRWSQAYERSTKHDCLVGMVWVFSTRLSLQNEHNLNWPVPLNKADKQWIHLALKSFRVDFLKQPIHVFRIVRHFKLYIHVGYLCCFYEFGLLFISL